MIFILLALLFWKPVYYLVKSKYEPTKKDFYTIKAKDWFKDLLSLVWGTD